MSHRCGSQGQQSWQIANGSPVASELSCTPWQGRITMFTNHTFDRCHIKDGRSDWLTKARNSAVHADRQAKAGDLLSDAVKVVPNFAATSLFPTLLRL